MGSTQSILDLSAWALELEPVLRKALDPATPTRIHRELAEHATECLEQGALLGDRAGDGEQPWRALLVGDDAFVALEDGFILARFDATNLISLRLETYDGRRWAVAHSGRGLAAFRQAALSRAAVAGEDTVMKVAAFGDRKLRFSRVFRPDGGEAEETDPPAVPGSLSPLACGRELALPALFPPSLLGANAVILRRAVESLKATQALPEPAPVLPPAQPAPVPVPIAPLPAAPPSPPRPPGRWRLVGLTGTFEGQVVPVEALAVLGRDRSADITVENPTVSRRHAELRPTDVGMILKDLGSANGTWFQKAKLEGPVLLKSGDTFVLGECAFRVERG